MSKLFGDIRQLALVVRDADATMREFASRLGIGPFYVVRNFEVAAYRYRGESARPPVLTLCFAQSGSLQIEIIQQLNDAPSAYRDFLASGLEGCQHICAWHRTTAEYDLNRAQLLDAGFQLVHEGTSRQPKARFAYFSTNLPGSLMIEISEALLPDMLPFTDQIKNSSAGWDGTDPIRNIAGQ